MGEQCGVCACLCVVVRICQIESVALHDREVPVEMRPSGLSVDCMETVLEGGDTYDRYRGLPKNRYRHITF